MAEKIPIILNIDTGIDDAVAIALASFSKKIDIKLIACGAGNVPPDKSAKNTYDILNLIKMTNIPIALGAKKTLKRENNKLYAHGKSGMGSYPFEKVDFKTTTENAIEEMKKIIEQNEGIVVVCLSPLTNIALLLQKYPNLANKFSILFSGGSMVEKLDNGLPYPSFNIACDPESYEIVEQSGVKIDVCPSDLGHAAYFNWQDVFKIKNTNHTGEVFEYIFRSYHDRTVKNGIATHDGCAIAYLCHPEIFKYEYMPISLVYYKELETGVLEFNSGNIERKVLTDININKFKKFFFKTLKKMP